MNHIIKINAVKNLRNTHDKNFKQDICTLNAIKIQKNISKILAYYVIKINYFIQKKGIRICKIL